MNLTITSVWPSLDGFTWIYPGPDDDIWSIPDGAVAIFNGMTTFPAFNGHSRIWKNEEIDVGDTTFASPDITGFGDDVIDVYDSVFVVGSDDTRQMPETGTVTVVIRTVLSLLVKAVLDGI